MRPIFKKQKSLEFFMKNAIFVIKAIDKDTFEPLFQLLNDSNIPFTVKKYKFGHNIDIEVDEKEIQQMIRVLATAKKYQLIKHYFS